MANPSPPIQLIHEDRVLSVDCRNPSLGAWSFLGNGDLNPTPVAPESPGQAAPKPGACELVYIGRWPATDDALATLKEFACRYGPKRTSLKVFYERGSDLLEGIRHAAGTQGRFTADFIGELPELTEEDVQTLASRGARLAAIAGWEQRFDQFDLDRLRWICEMGLQVPVVIYLDSDNASDSIDFAERCLEANYDSGVSFLPSILHPLCDPDHANSTNPWGIVEALMTAYKKFRHHDLVMEPVRSVMESIASATAGEASELTESRRFRILEDGRTVAYRKSASLAVHSVSLDRPLNDRCSDCQWKYLCGGCEPLDGNAFESICIPFQVFFEVLVKEMHLTHEMLLQAST
ncbi:MAG: hypothetical protein AAGD07_20110 [Planctomycetota bacterium]